MTGLGVDSAAARLAHTRPTSVRLPAGATWTAVAHAGEVGHTPRPVRIDDLELVLFRDGTGAVGALDDRCCHRRVPLSLGHLTPDGALQCAYHGWCFDRAGACVAIPQLRSDERIPSRFAVPSLPVREQAGFVWVWPGDADARGVGEPPTLPFLESAQPGLRRSRVHVNRPVTAVMAGLLDPLNLRTAGSAHGPVVRSSPGVVAVTRRPTRGPSSAAVALLGHGLVLSTIRRSSSGWAVRAAWSCVPRGPAATDVVYAVGVEGGGATARAASAAVAAMVRMGAARMAAVHGGRSPGQVQEELEARYRAAPDGRDDAELDVAAILHAN